MISTIIGPVSPTVEETIGITSSVVTLLCVGPLVWLTWHHKARPSPVTWGIWAAVGLVATLAMAVGGAPTNAWLLKLALSLGPVAVCVVALLRGGADRLDRHDWASLIIGAIGTVVYGFSEVGMVAVGMAMLVDAVGAWPTWRNAWRRPHDELILTYALALGSVVAVLAALPTPWTWLSASYLTFLAVQMASIIAVLALARHSLVRRDVVRHGGRDVADQRREPLGQ